MLEGSNFVVVILAAGESKRFGRPKQLADWQGQPLLLSIIKKVLACDIKPYVALGANSDSILRDEILKSYLDKVLFIDGWSEGLSRSIVESVQYLERQHPRGIVFLLADQPLIELGFLKDFFLKVSEAPRELLSTSYKRMGGKLGVPAYFPYSYFGALKKLRGDQGAKYVLEKNKAEILAYDGCLIDIDEPEDLVRAGYYLGD